ncbi:NAD(P)-binding Rossmann-fold superfamily protein [Klebsormidium nitens]|uniref:NAD(P)-binding Rossmann-fold superfamily protein n=1 Tax=Klebsormidium nitens TaxID=105231 RepID=A0A1Y1HXQ8_KLENI|nr:NAD(P)-binding Rossmann-fold superfamily protein [Klebsormidium nitens]|eukprot:GAQ83450.1 NAD(P)-binding Rossmann-fold superfamily protein [Klebsormidium nitens]
MALLAVRKARLLLPSFLEVSGVARSFGIDSSPTRLISSSLISRMLPSHAEPSGTAGMPLAAGSEGFSFARREFAAAASGQAQVFAPGTEAADKARSASLPSSSSPPQSAAKTVPASAPPVRDRLLVIGGNGFVGGHICKAAVEKGYKVSSLNRSGPPQHSESWVKHVDWIRGNVFEPPSWRHSLKDVQGVISCVGAFGSYETMKRVCGDANVTAVNTAAEEGVKRFVFISAADMGLPTFVLRGYFEGKREAERAIREKLPYGGIIFRPSFIHGNRRVGSLTLPLGLVGSPLEAIFKSSAGKWVHGLPLVGPLIVPPINVETLAKAAVLAAKNNVVPPGIMDVWQISRLAER